MLFVNDFYGLYELKGLKIQFSPWKIESQILWNDVFYLFNL